MPLVIPLFIINLFCSWFQCELGAKPPFIYTNPTNTKILRETLTGRSELEYLKDEYSESPLVLTKLGPVQGFIVNISDNRQIYSFTGIPYGEPPQLFRDPKPRKPWRGILQATSPSPFCLQVSGASMGMVRGQTDCLYLDVHSPRLPDPAETKRPGLPIIIVLPAGANMYGKSQFFGPAYLLREDIILVALNVRFGVFGYLSTGDDASPGNYALKDQALAIKWVYENGQAFGGDPKKIIIAGISSGAYSAHLMLFTKHESRNYVAGILAISGSATANHGLDTLGRVRSASNIIAKSVGCPTSDNGKSREMVECMQRIEPNLLATSQLVLYKQSPYLSKNLGPTLEPDLPNAFISELPEVQYEKGKVAPIPLILSRAEDETSLVMQGMRYVFLPLFRKNWFNWMPISLQLGLRNNHHSRGKNVSFEESQLSLLKINQFYFNKTGPPRFIFRNDFIECVHLFSDTMYNAPMWKSVELHHKVAPTYVYMNKHKAFLVHPVANLVLPLVLRTEFGASHATDFVLFFNNTKSFPTLPPGSDFDKASRNLINMIANFGFYGKPLYRTTSGTLVDVWKPVTDMKRPMVLEVGLVHNISMIRDPLVGTKRLKIWEEVKF